MDRKRRACSAPITDRLGIALFKKNFSPISYHLFPPISYHLFSPISFHPFHPYPFTLFNNIRLKTKIRFILKKSNFINKRETHSPFKKGEWKRELSFAYYTLAPFDRVISKGRISIFCKTQLLSNSLIIEFLPKSI